MSQLGRSLTNASAEELDGSHVHSPTSVFIQTLRSLSV